MPQPPRRPDQVPPPEPGLPTQPNPTSKAQSGLPTQPQPDLALPQLDSLTRPQPAVDFYPGGRRYVVAAVAFAICVLAGMAALVHSYLIAQTTLSNTAEFAWFWAGMILLVLPLAVLIARRPTPPAVRTALLTLYGGVSYAPKLLRNPASPLFHDEFAHWRATFNILSTGKLFQPDPIIQVIARYPGLHATTAALVHATGLTIWQAATLLLVICHVSLVLGIATLAQSLGLSSRTASVAAVLYGLNSSFLYFDTQFAYESMAITLVVWALVAYVRAVRAQPGRGRAAWSTLTVVLGAGTVITHHLSMITLVSMMLLTSAGLSVAWLARRKGWVRTAVTSWGLTLGTALVAGAWFRFAAPATFSYLSPYARQGLAELVRVAEGAGGARQLFGASLSPQWEQKSAYFVPVFALALAIGGLFLLRARMRDGSLPRGPRRAFLIAFGVLGLVYFPSTVFILAPAGAEGARRSWAFTWIGLCVLAAPAVVWLADWAGRRSRRWLRTGVRMGLLAALAIALVGGTAAGLNAAYRFPGPFLYGSDTRSVTPELLGTSEWFTVRFGERNNIVTDRFTGLVFGSFGVQNPADPSAGFPAYNLYLAKPGARITPDFLLSELQGSRYLYLVVDARMAYDVPEIGVYFEPNEPSFLTKAGKSIFFGRLGKFNTIPWMVKVYQSDTYSVYRLTLPAGRANYQPQPPKLGNRLGTLSVTP
jgi:hypothetical protein